jgi:hypothetical protein
LDELLLLVYSPIPLLFMAECFGGGGGGGRDEMAGRGPREDNEDSLREGREDTEDGREEDDPRTREDTEEDGRDGYAVREEY